MNITGNSSVLKGGNEANDNKIWLADEYDVK